MSSGGTYLNETIQLVGYRPIAALFGRYLPISFQIVFPGNQNDRICLSFLKNARQKIVVPQAEVIERLSIGTIVEEEGYGYQAIKGKIDAAEPLTSGQIPLEWWW